jgi:hypothetical protein
MSAMMIMLNNTFEPGGLNLTSEYAPSDDTHTVRNTIVIVTRMLLNAYLVNGTVELPSDINRSEKFLVVGFLTKNLGGNRNNSCSGLNAVETRYTKGSEVNATKISMNAYKTT